MFFFFQEKTRLSDELQQLDLQLKQLPASTHTMKAMLEAKVHVYLLLNVCSHPSQQPLLPKKTPNNKNQKPMKVMLDARD